ncbi:HNH endonuclease [Streptosporangium jomthongense]|uniref:HNH endonuclease n=1 Tax=Streptosporangium jomthongense TaxID=1193683 RepID=A0ABV8F6U6_9ACTN
MSGKRARCFYCGDSLGADVDHYWPIALKHSLTFTWKNWLLVCPNCNRHKSDRFPTDSSGNPLLLDPSTRDPWKHLILDVHTGLIAPRYSEEDYDPIGEATLDVLHCLLNESISEGRLRVIKRLRRAVADFLNREEKAEAWERLLQEVAEDDYGVSLWLFAWEGSREDPFSSFKCSFPHLNRRLISFAMRWPYVDKPIDVSIASLM